jgi:ribonuclease HII
VRAGAPDGALDQALCRRYGLVAGVDEVGRGALAGPVVVAAVALGPECSLSGLDDSKRVTPRRRERLSPEIRERAVTWALAQREVDDIDRLNILGATVAAMKEAVGALSPAPGCVIVDAVKLSDLGMPVVAEPRADSRYLCVAAASIVAKVARDSMMVLLAREYPGYGWERNKGYATAEHLAALRRLGPSPLHRRSFAPVRVLA